MQLTRNTRLTVGLALMCVSVPIVLLRMRHSRLVMVLPHPPVEPETAVVSDELPGPSFDDGRAPMSVIAARSGFYAAPSGSRLCFAIDTHQDSSLTLAGDQPQSTELSMDAQGDLVLTILARREHEILASVAYEDLQLACVAGGQAADEAVESQIVQELAQTVRVRLRDDGTALAWNFPTAMAPSTRMMERTFLALTRFVVPCEAGDEWSAHETDGTGEYTVDYRRVGNDALRPEVVRWRRALVPSGSAEESPVETTVEDHARAIFDLQLGWLVAAECEEQVRVESPNAGFAFKVDSRISLSLKEARRERVAAEVGLWSLPWCDTTGEVDRRLDAEAHEASRAEAEIAGLRLENVLYDLEGIIHSAGLDSRELFDARELLKTYLSQRPAELERFELLVSDGSLDDDSLGVALSALGALGLPAGETFLAQFMADATRTDQQRRLAMLALFQVSTPEPSAAQAIAAQWLEPIASPELRSTALLLLGAHARGKPERCRELIAQEERATADGLLDTYLAALGNAHLFAEVERFVSHEDAAVRAAAERILACR